MNTMNYEIIVVDNGSIDETVKIARKLGVKTIIKPLATISELRNFGAAESKSEILCFIDSDISLAKNWEEQLELFLNNQKFHPLFITGSRCSVETGNTSFIEKNWFLLLQKSKSQYINSGHMITNRETFDRISGFDPALKTGEDHDFCKRAEKLDIPIIENKKLKAFHRGYPKTIRQFFEREAWHGRADVENIRTLINSKTGLASLANLISIAILIFGAVSQSYFEAIVGASSMIAILSILTYQKFGKMPVANFSKTSFCFEIYLLGRAWSLFFKKRRPAARQ